MEKIKKNLVIFSLPRSGSTMILNSINNIFCLEDGDKVPRYWEVDKIPKISEFEYKIILIRDFRDLAASHWRIYRAKYDCNGNVINKMNEEQVEVHADWAREQADMLKEVTGKYPNSLILKYEDYWNNLDFLFDKLEEFMRLKISKELRKKAKKEVEFNKYKKISDSIGEDFGKIDYKSQIHAKHIYAGTPGTWKDFIQNEHKKYFLSFLQKSLDKWGYK